METKPNTANDNFIALQPSVVTGTEYVGPLIHPLTCRTRHEAFRAAAWLATHALALPEESDQNGVTFQDVLKAVAEA